MPRRYHALHLLLQALAVEPGTYKRPHNPLPNHIASILSVFMDGALHGLYIHTCTYTYTYTYTCTYPYKYNEKRHTIHSQMETQTSHTITRESSGLLKGTYAMEIKLIFLLVISNKQHYLSLRH